jgi:uncharacterized protein (TIGR03435 family)
MLQAVHRAEEGRECSAALAFRCYTRTMRRPLIQCAIVSAIVVTTSVVHLFGQARPEQSAPAFAVASIKRADAFAERPGRLGSVNVVMTPGRLIARNASLKDLIRDAYSLDDYQVFGGPMWISSERFDVDARGVGPREQLLFMLQTLLKERFKLAVHHESKELAIYALVVDKGGPKFRPLDATEQECYPMCREPAPLNRLRQRDVPSLARYLTRLGAEKPIVDRTGLTGSFKIELDVQTIMNAALERGGPPSNENIYRATVDAVQDELGLKLRSVRSPVDVLVIDHVERPTPN